MANTQHFETLKQGVEEWNEWYSSHPEVIADLSGLCLAGFDLSGFVLTGVNLTGAELRSADLSRADLRGASLKNVSFDRATLDGADLRYAVGLTQAGLAGAKGNSATQLPANIQSLSSWEPSRNRVCENPELIRALFTDGRYSQAGG